MDYFHSSNDTSYLRTIAILIIINSHLDAVYGSSLIASGGAIGNTLFFLLSGYGLKYSFDKKKTSFLTWMKKRLIGIYPAVWLSNFLWLIISLFSVLITFNYLDFIISFIYTNYWFINAIILFYILGFSFLNIKSSSVFLFFYLSVILIYVLIYSVFLDVSENYIVEQYPEKILFYYIVFLTGFLLYHVKNRLNEFRYYILCSSFLLIITYIIMKIQFRGSIVFAELQIVQQIIQLLIAIGLTATNFNFQLHPKLNEFKMLRIFNNILSSITLEIYILHGVFILAFAEMSTPIYVKVFLIFSLSIASSILLKISTIKITTKLKR